MTLWDAKQISEYLQVKAGTIRAWTCNGVIPSVKLGPGEKGVVRYLHRGISFSSRSYLSCQNCCSVGVVTVICCTILWICDINLYPI